MLLPSLKRSITGPHGPVLVQRSLPHVVVFQNRADSIENISEVKQCMELHHQVFRSTTSDVRWTSFRKTMHGWQLTGELWAADGVALVIQYILRSDSW